MYQPPNAGHAAGIGERCGREVMHFLIGFSATLSQDANAVDDHVNLRKQRQPRIDGQQPFESHRAALATMRLHWEATRGAFGVPAANDDFVLTSKQCCNGVAADESCAAEHKDAYQASRSSAVVRWVRREAMRADTP